MTSRRRNNSVAVGSKRTFSEALPLNRVYEYATQPTRRHVSVPIFGILLLSGREGDGHGLPILRKPFLEKDLTRTMSQTTGLC